MLRELRLIAIALALFSVTPLSIVQTARQERLIKRNATAALPAEARQFDFWLGNWNLTVGNANVPSQITSFGVGEGIAILENYSNGFGTSVSVYNTREQKWYQTWFDQDQLLIEASGEFRDGKMVLTGKHTETGTGNIFAGRLSWFNITGNRYDFLYEISGNGGQSWQQSFSARAVRTAPAALSYTSSDAYLGSTRDSITTAALPNRFRQFDFLKGEWDVETFGCPSPGIVTGALFGAGEGFAMLEDFRCGDGYRGTSVSFYSTQTGKWRYIWLDTEELLLELEGSKEGDNMVFEGEFSDLESGMALLGRVTYARISQSELERSFEVSEDNGQTWSTRRADRYLKATIFQPGNFRAKKIKTNKVKLAWTDTSPGEYRFEVLRWDGAQWVVVKSVEANSTATTIKRLEPGTEYRLAVRACDGNRCSQQLEITVTTR
jgi:hypothetical protein